MTLQNTYRRFRAGGASPAQALRDARTLLEWAKYHEEDIRLRIEPDDNYEWDEETAKHPLAHEGTWGIIGEYHTADGQWHHADSCWGFVCYNRVTDPFENWYVAGQTASRLSREHDGNARLILARLIRRARKGGTVGR